MKYYVEMLYKAIYNDLVINEKLHIEYIEFVDNMSLICTKRSFNKHITNFPLLDKTYKYYEEHLVNELNEGYISNMFFFATDYYKGIPKLISYFNNLLRQEKIKHLMNE